MILYCKIKSVNFIARITFDGSRCVYAEAPLQHLKDKSFLDFTDFVRANKWDYLISSKEFGQYTPAEV